MSAIDKHVSRVGDKDAAIRIIQESSENTLIIVLAHDKVRGELACSTIGGHDFFASEMAGLMAYGMACAQEKLTEDKI